MNPMKRGSMWAQLLRGASRWGALALAAFYLNFISVHLATETHLYGDGHDHEHATETDHDHDHDTGDHAPHDASEHMLDVALKGAEVLHPPVLAIVSDTFILDAPVAFTWTPHFFERERPPGESPPDPLQPRAPPLA